MYFKSKYRKKFGINSYTPCLKPILVIIQLCCWVTPEGIKTHKAGHLLSLSGVRKEISSVKERKLVGQDKDNR